MNRRILSAALAAFAILPASTPALAAQVTPAGPDDPTLRTTAGATIGWVVGASAGGFLGHAITDDEYDDWVGAIGAVVGAGVGGAVGAAFGAHSGNDGRGNTVMTLLSTTAATGLLLLAADRGAPQVPLIVIPVGQILTAVLVERSTGGGR